jgi:flagellin-like protein
MSSRAPRLGRRRKRADRAVSPIIATILLGAITVVLAAVLYILISGLAVGTAAEPLGTSFAWGQAANVTAMTAPSGCSSGKECYSLEIAGTDHKITASKVHFAVRASTGAALAFSSWTFSLVNPGGSSTASWTGAGACVGTGCGTVLQSGDVIIVNTGTSGTLAGDKIAALGDGTSYQGEVDSNTLPP